MKTQLLNVSCMYLIVGLLDFSMDLILCICFMDVISDFFRNSTEVPAVAPAVFCVCCSLQKITMLSEILFHIPINDFYDFSSLTHT